VQMVKNHAYSMCYPVCLRHCRVRAESVHAPRGAVGLGRCLVLWCSIFLLVVGAECLTGLLLWLCRHHKLSTVRFCSCSCIVGREGIS